MRKELKMILLVAAGAVLFSLIFWQEKLGVNTLLFDAFIIAAIFHLYPQAISNRHVSWLLAAHIISLAMILVQNTLLSKLVFTITLLLLVGFVQYVHRSAWFAAGSVLMNILFFLGNLLDALKAARVNFGKGRHLFKYIRFAFFPLVLVGIFVMIYSFSNTIFLDLANKFTAKVMEFLTALFGSFSFSRLLFTIAGLYIVGAMLLRNKTAFFSQKEAAFSDELLRQKKSVYRESKQTREMGIGTLIGKLGHGVMALKNENTIGITSLVLLNALLFVVNLLDIIYVWFNFEYTPNMALYKMVHEGTELLILSIVLAMMVVLFFFKGNLNFYTKNKWLKYAAYVWILQNTVLLVSVLIRDCYYITHFGLAYKRIGVLFFLLSVLVGLITVFIKIYSRKTNYFLFRVNAGSIITILVLSTLVNWDDTIAAYNLKHRDSVPVDWNFLLTLSDKTLPLIDSSIALVKAQQPNVNIQGSATGNFCEKCFINKLQERKQRFMLKQKQYSWLSWNLSDAFVKDYLDHNRNHLEAGMLHVTR